MNRPNPKKDPSARRKRNPLYWETGGRGHFKEHGCPKCRQAMRREQSVRARCKSCKALEAKAE